MLTVLGVKWHENTLFDVSVQAERERHRLAFRRATARRLAGAAESPGTSPSSSTWSRHRRGEDEQPPRHSRFVGTAGPPCAPGRLVLHRRRARPGGLRRPRPRRSGAAGAGGRPGRDPAARRRIGHGAGGGHLQRLGDRRTRADGEMAAQHRRRHDLDRHRRRDRSLVHHASDDRGRRRLALSRRVRERLGQRAWSHAATLSTSAGNVVGPAGGTLVFLGGAVRLVFPAGAVAAPTTIEVQATPFAGPRFPEPVNGTTYSFGPDGIVFAQPVSRDYPLRRRPGRRRDRSADDAHRQGEHRRLDLGTRRPSTAPRARSAPTSAASAATA